MLVDSMLSEKAHFFAQGHVVQPPHNIITLAQRLQGYRINIAAIGSGAGAPESISLDRGSRSPTRRDPPRRRQNVWRWCATRQTHCMGAAEMIGPRGDNLLSRSELDQA